MTTQALASKLGTEARPRLLAAAAGLFARHGYAAASVRGICEAAGVTAPVLYWHFRNKEGMYLAVLEDGMRMHHDVLAAAVDADGSAMTRIARVLETAADLASRNRDVLLVVQGALYGVSHGAPAFDLVTPRKTLRKAVMRLVEEGMAAGEFRKGAAGDMTDALLGALDFQFRAIRMGASPRAARAHIKRVARVVFDGMLKRRA
jgi:AcrR family transcriptional regulator